uniref:GYF_2 domain-containing protein n=1 Tax=Heterorhabditis bacteriophora TaxID=37862 RepID=A0A1I7WU60_HETBA
MWGGQDNTDGGSMNPWNTQAQWSSGIPSSPYVDQSKKMHLPVRIQQHQQPRYDLQPALQQWNAGKVDQGMVILYGYEILLSNIIDLGFIEWNKLKLNLSICSGTFIGIILQVQPCLSRWVYRVPFFKSLNTLFTLYLVLLTIFV